MDNTELQVIENMYEKIKNRGIDTFYFYMYCKLKRNAEKFVQLSECDKIVVLNFANDVYMQNYLCDIDILTEVIQKNIDDILTNWVSVDDICEELNDKMSEYI